jgi:phage terminase small subunit
MAKRDKMRADFIEYYLSGNWTKGECARKAGCTDKGASRAASRWLSDPDVKKIIAERQKKVAEKNDCKRSRILKGLLDIFDYDKNSKNKISAATEINKMQGYYQPAESKVDVKHTGSVVLEIPYNNRRMRDE